MNIDDDLEKLLNNLPFFIYQHLHNYSNKEKLIEIVLIWGGDLKLDLLPDPNIYHKKLFHGKI